MTAPSVWCIYFVAQCQRTQPYPKDKYVAIVCRDSLGCFGFFINSDIRQYAQTRPALLHSQVKITVSEYPFLKHDSYINCAELNDFPDDTLKSLCGRIGDHTKQQINDCGT